MIRGHYRADCSLMFRLSKPRTEFFGHANLDSQMIPDSQQERQVAHMSSELEASTRYLRHCWCAALIDTL